MIAILTVKDDFPFEEIKEALKNDHCSWYENCPLSTKRHFNRMYAGYFERRGAFGWCTCNNNIRAYFPKTKKIVLKGRRHAIALNETLFDKYVLSYKYVKTQRPDLKPTETATP